MRSPVAAHTARWMASTVARTWHIEAVGEEHIARLRTSRVPIIYVVWHGQLLAPLWHRRHEGITLLISAHLDGGRLAHAALPWGYRVVRGSSTRGQVSALRGLIRALASGHEAAVTPDGPRGPARRVKPGAVAAALRAGAALVPVGVGASTAWRLGSWDGFVVPHPFARVRIVYGVPFRLRSGPKGLAEGTTRLQEALDSATDLARC